MLSKLVTGDLLSVVAKIRHYHNKKNYQSQKHKIRPSGGFFLRVFHPL